MFQIHYGLFVLSSLFIAAGRMSEVLNVNKTKKVQQARIKITKTISEETKESKKINNDINFLFVFES